MNFAAWLDRHRRSILVLATALALAGLSAALSLPIGLYPDASFPRVRVTIDAGSQSADQMVLEVTQPVEQAVRAVPGVVNVKSVTSRGSAMLTVDFAWGTNMTTATLGVNAALAQLVSRLPPGVSFTALRMQPNVFPFMAYALTSHSVSLVKMRNLAQYRLVPLLSGVPGIAHAQVQGGDTGEVEVSADPRRLAAYHLTLTDLVNAISGAASLQSVGRVEDHDLLYLLLANNTVHDVRDVKNIVLRAGPGYVLRLGDVAKVRLGVVPQFLDVDANGKQAVTLLLYQQQGSDMVSTAHAVEKALAGFQSQIPPGVTLSKWYDQSTLVLAAAGSVRDAILIGVVLAAIVLFLFLRNWRITLLAITIVPAALAASVLVLSMFGLSFNIMTLGGLAASVGLVIDDVIVMIEFIAHRSATGWREPGRLWVLRSGGAFFRPLAGSSAATLIVFVPLAFLSGVSGAFFKALSITVASTLIASWVLTALVVPLLAATLVNFERWTDPGEKGKGWLGQMHGRLLAGFFRRPALLTLPVLALLVAGLVSYRNVQTGFLPSLDEGGFVMDYLTAPGTSLTETVREMREIEAILRKDPAVANFSMRAGAGFGGDLAESNKGDFVIRLIPLSQRPSVDVVMNRIADEVIAKVPGVAIDPHQLMSDELGDMTGTPQPIDIKLSADTPAVLPATARRVAAAIAKIKGVDSIDDGVVPAGDAIEIHVDQTRAAALGLDPAKVTAMLKTAMDGTVAATFEGTNQLTGIRVRLDGAARMNSAALKQLPLSTPSGALVPLSSIASFTTISGQPEITRENLQQVVDVTARLNGRGLGAGIADVKRVLAQKGVLAPGVTYKLGGLYKQQQIAFAGLIRVFVAALLAEFILLLLLYERFLWVAAIICTSLLSTTAVFTGLYVTGVPLNITAMMGMVMIVGIATEMAIFFVSEAQQLLETRPAREAFAQAAANRLRPIAMTTLAAILTLMPLALDLGQGAGMQQPLAIAIIAGLLVQFPLVLLALPVLLLRFSKADK
ncbi:efflux RND transporter permease subunit [Acidocella aminolytica]|uniref:Efflux system protein/acriflavin resistance protein n=1 Tax=Acidocella aminolytica 101 = DSM 11237 TaxID=1120923 RepID=A0A0D6PD31_9PROT|nr:efflux RND transporter permease subunit [Acidocella aminolytica]GAN79650.1 efflux system protein/acriflavin resistance protein [Acidocella aminolytica 101 = DSM 11237]GBQ41344.1 acriflavin resistance protein [Acidocella aminolytica 101 = DSM 11237]SHF05501.1 heavy metal efflux pump, CzcA family [Acidocella aminolytica 101 = DSM 11237]